MKKHVLVSTLLAVMAAPSFASDFYLVAEVGQSKLDVDADDYSYKKSETAFALGGGYKFNDVLALELAYRDLGKFDQGSDVDFGGGETISTDSYTKVHVFQASLVAQLPVNESAAFYGRLGVGSLKAKSDYELTIVSGGETSSESGSVSDSATKAVLGVGFKYAVSQSAALRVEYNQYSEWDDATLSSTVLGFTYQF